jgi:hypothetical protein
MIKYNKIQYNKIQYKNIMYLVDEETPNIGLKLSFDNVRPELYTLMYILSIVLIVTIIFLLLHILEFIIKKSIKLYEYFKYQDYDSLIS